jgi:hypothetical protein
VIDRPGALVSNRVAVQQGRTPPKVAVAAVWAEQVVGGQSVCRLVQRQHTFGTRAEARIRIATWITLLQRSSATQRVRFQESDRLRTRVLGQPHRGAGCIGRTPRNEVVHVGVAVDEDRARQTPLPRSRTPPGDERIADHVGGHHADDRPSQPPQSPAAPTRGHPVLLGGGLTRPATCRFTITLARTRQPRPSPRQRRRSSWTRRLCGVPSREAAVRHSGPRRGQQRPLGRQEQPRSETQHDRNVCTEQREPPSQPRHVPPTSSSAAPGHSQIARSIAPALRRARPRCTRALHARAGPARATSAQAG